MTDFEKYDRLPFEPENVEDVLCIVETYGPLGADINENLRYQIILANEIHRMDAIVLRNQKMNAELVAALEVMVESVGEAVRLSALYNGYEYSFKSVVEKARAALAKAGK